MNVFNTTLQPALLGKTLLDQNHLTFAVKANIGCGYPASASTPSLRNWTPKGYSPVVKSLVDNGHTILAITNMHELAYGNTSENPAYGDVDNPRKTGYISGGSSGGSAVAVAINAISFALGTDTAGSMLMPASLSGVVGYRPTTGLYDTADILVLSSTTDTIGVFAQKVATIQIVHQVIIPTYTPSIRPLKDVRIGIPRKYFYEILDSEVARITEEALRLLCEAGVVLVQVDLPSDFTKDLQLTCFDLMAYETYRHIPKYLKEQGAPVTFKELIEEIGDQKVKQAIINAGEITTERYHQCQEAERSVRKNYDDYFRLNNLEAFVCPTTILPAMKRPTELMTKVCGQDFLTSVVYSRNTFSQAIAGVPCISLPSGLTSDGLPVGLELVAPRDNDSNLLALAVSVEEVLPSLSQLSFKDFKNRL